MKALLRSFVCICAVACFGSVAEAGGIAGLDVKVTDASGKVCYIGKTDANGGFSTGKLSGGNYIVQLNSKNAAMKTGRFALLAAAGKKRVTANAVPGKEFLGAGVALKLDVANGLNIRGSVTDVNVAGGTGDSKVKIINGVRYVWVSSGGTGSNLGGRWVEEGALDTFNRNTLKPDAFSNMRDSHGDIPTPDGP